MPGKGNRPREGADDAFFSAGPTRSGRKGQKRTLCQPSLTARVNLGRRVRHGIDSGWASRTESGAGPLGSATNQKMRDDAPNRKKCHILRMEACSSAFFDNSDAVMDRDMAFLASNDASRAMHGGRETTEYTEQRTSGHTRSGPRECVLAVPFAFVCFVDFVVTLLSAPRRKWRKGSQFFSGSMPFSAKHLNQ